MKWTTDIQSMAPPAGVFFSSGELADATQRTLHSAAARVIRLSDPSDTDIRQVRADHGQPRLVDIEASGARRSQRLLWRTSQSSWPRWVCMKTFVRSCGQGVVK
ncbi:MAG TPA: hypothetical protein VFQ77_10585 [Pseudonocardiaceae bacterium]|nr:hypothetical protein [Pseudonocardiaceae bacterium]